MYTLTVDEFIQTHAMKPFVYVSQFGSSHDNCEIRPYWVSL